MSTFEWDKNYDNHEQVRPYYQDYLAVRAELEAVGNYPYNDSFKGRIPGIAGKDEGTAIYLLQGMHQRDEMYAKVDAFLNDGGERVEWLDEVRRGTVIHYGFYMGGTGWREYPESRLVPRNGKPHMVIPKGKRTNGFSVWGGNVLIKAKKVSV